MDGQTRRQFIQHALGCFQIRLWNIPEYAVAHFGGVDVQLQQGFATGRLDHDQTHPAVANHAAPADEAQPLELVELPGQAGAGDLPTARQFRLGQASGRSLQEIEQTGPRRLLAAGLPGFGGYGLETPGRQGDGESDFQLQNLAGR